MWTATRGELQLPLWNDLIDELDSRDIDVCNLNKADLQSKLSEILHGIQRPAALI